MFKTVLGETPPPKKSALKIYIPPPKKKMYFYLDYYDYSICYVRRFLPVAQPSGHWVLRKKKYISTTDSCPEKGKKRIRFKANFIFRATKK